MILWKHDLQCQSCKALLPIESLVGDGITVFCSQGHLDIYKAETTGHPLYPNGQTQIQLTDLPQYVQNILAGETGLFFLRAD